MDGVKDSFIDLERRRRQLEQNVTELKKLLQHWQTWEAEYEGLKEEIEALGPDSSLEKLIVVVDEYEGDLLTTKEIRELSRDNKGKQRNAKQIQGLLSRRIDYVQENVRSVQKRYDDAEKKLARVNIVMKPEATDEEGLPLTEITEELDDDDNVVSSYVQRPGDAAPQIVEALRKQGITDLPDMSKDGSSEDPSNTSKETSRPDTFSPAGHSNTVPPPSGSQSHSNTTSRKKVSFAELPEPSEEALPPSRSNSTPKPSRVHQDVVERLAHDEPIVNPVVPTGETPEETQLRQDMLQYNLNDIGAIVAEINLEEGDANDLDDYGDYSDEESDEDIDDDEEEDHWGRTKMRVVTDDYREQMLALERKLNAKSMINAGPDFNDTPADNEIEEPVERKSSGVGEKKGVRFADSLNVEEAPVAKESTPLPPREDSAKLPPMADTIVERARDTSGSNGKGRPKKVSAFKAARATRDTTKAGMVSSNPESNHMSDADQVTSLATAERQDHPSLGVELLERPPVPEGPEGTTLADSLVERPMDEAENEAYEPDELDPQLMRQEVAVKYHEMRNHMIQRNGGFSKQSEDSEEELDQDKPKVSRFKAARLSQIAK